MEPKLLVVLVVLGWVGTAGTQTTYRRACDCEYTVDGRCAYTLLLPGGAAGAGAGEDTSRCPMKPDLSAEDKMTLEHFRRNLTDLRLASGDQARMLSRLQSLLMDQQATLSGLATMIANRNDTASPEVGGKPPCELCPQVAQAVEEQQRSLADLYVQLAQVQGNFATVSKSLEVAVAEALSAFNVSLNVQRQQAEQLLDSVQSAVGSGSGVEAALSAIVSNGFVCQRRGLLVSGSVRNISSDMISVSSMYNDGHGADRGRIYTQKEGTLMGAWCATEPNAKEEWLQFDLGKISSIFGVVTKGRADYQQWVTSYTVNYTNTDPTVEGSTWTTYIDVLGDEMVFPGNVDQNTAKVNMLWQPIRARYIRIVPLTSDSNKCMRADVIGCLDEQ